MRPYRLEIAQQPTSDGPLIARLSGKLSLETVSAFLQQTRAIAAEKLVLDMSGVSFLDSAGVGALVQLFVHRRGQSRKLAVAALTSQGTAVMQVAGLMKLIPTFATIEEASV
jgi:anti-sigma B factor antagonist